MCQPGRRESNWDQGRDFSSLTRLPASLIHWAPWLYNGPVQCTTNVQCTALSSLRVDRGERSSYLYYSILLSKYWEFSFGFSFHKSSVVERGNDKIRKNTRTNALQCVRMKIQHFVSFHHFNPKVGRNAEIVILCLFYWYLQQNDIMVPITVNITTVRTWCHPWSDQESVWCQFRL